MKYEPCGAISENIHGSAALQLNYVSTGFLLWERQKYADVSGEGGAGAIYPMTCVYPGFPLERQKWEDVSGEGSAEGWQQSVQAS